MCGAGGGLGGGLPAADGDAAVVAKIARKRYNQGVIVFDADAPDYHGPASERLAAAQDLFDLGSAGSATAHRYSQRCTG